MIGMSSLTLVIPFALPPHALARDLLSSLNLPALAKLVARARRVERILEAGGWDAIENM